VGEYVVAFLLKTLSKSDGVFCFLYVLENCLMADNGSLSIDSRVSDGSGILLRDQVQKLGIKQKD
jgi:hypothetical protein